MNPEIRRTVEKVTVYLEVLQSMVYHQRLALAPFRLRLLDSEGEPPFPEGTEKGVEVRPGEMWGPPLTGFVLSTAFKVPPDWGKSALYLPLGDAGDFNHPEALVYIDGISCASCDRYHHEIMLDESARDGKVHTLDLHGWTGGIDLSDSWKRSSQAAQTGFMLMQQCEVVEIHEPTRQLAQLMSAALGVTREMEPDNPVRSLLLTVLNETLMRLDTRAPLGGAFYASVPEALGVLQEGLRRSGPALNIDIAAVGHAHIDVAWLWTLEQARQKTRRSFSNVIRLMDEYPEFRFAQSQAQLYEYILQDDPDMFAAIRSRVEEGRWEPVGGMWVESDSNLIGPESMVRQFLLGRAFFKRHFGERRSRVLWLPDVFGFNWSLPQLAREAGLDFFFTTKMGWNEFNRLPFDSFWWQGLDGSRILTHFSPVPELSEIFNATYNAMVSPREIMGSWPNARQASGRTGRNQPILMSFGYGDGGGGPTHAMLENVRIFSDFPGAPRVHCETAENFFENLEADFGENLPVWNDELYLEYHRGTYTTQARSKQANRRREYALHDVEFLGAAAAAISQGFRYPREEILQAWKLVCLNQFHDILPGSSIREVYDVSAEQYQQVAEYTSSAQTRALESLAAVLGGDLLLVNPTSFTVHEPVLIRTDRLDKQSFRHAGDSAMTVQPVEGGLLLQAGPLRPYSVTALEASDSPVARRGGKLSVSRSHLENDCLRLEFSPEGDLIRIYDRELGREVLSPGRTGNELQLFEDRPALFEAWDINIYYDDRMWLPEPAHAIEVIEEGPLRAALRIVRRIHNSTITQEIRLLEGSRRVDFATMVDWQERQMLLKTAFPVDVFAPRATYEIQWGNIERPTHRNTSWDWAKFEVPAQKWVDLSEGGYGVSLLNDCKYGHDIHENVIRLTLLRAPNYPDPQADLGLHHFCYSLLPHPGRWGRETAAQASMLNDPVIGYLTQEPSPVRRDQASLFRLDDPNLIIETVKPAEDGRGWVLRLYEFRRCRGQAELVCSLPTGSAWRTTILEEDQYELEPGEEGYQISYKPFEVISLRVIPESI